MRKRQLAIEQRIIKEANYFVTNRTTVRDVARKFGVSKSTVHIDLTRTLKNLDSGLHAQVREILKSNTEIRHLHGGAATKEKYSQLKNK